jgi:hypothetical protein
MVAAEEPMTRHRTFRNPLPAMTLAFALAVVAVLASADDGDPNAPGSDLDYWLRRATPADANSGSDANATDVDPDAEGTNPFRPTQGFLRSGALPGVMELSDGTLIAGGLYGTREKPWDVFVAKEKRWRQIPPIAVLSITAKPVEEKMELEWRWKAMGEPEKIYTGRKYPTRRFEWTFHLIDDTKVTGVVKGQPLWVELPHATKPAGPYILHERSKGEPGQTLAELVYVKRVLVSRKMMDKVLAWKEVSEKQQAAPDDKP